MVRAWLKRLGEIWDDTFRTVPRMPEYGKAPHGHPKGYLEQRTGWNEQYWVAHVQELIRVASREGEDPNHDECDPEVWVAELAKDVMACAPEDGEPYDGNMWLTSTMGYILVLWYARIQRAKGYDSRRPIKLRQRALTQRASILAHFVHMFLDESRDHEFFPGQPWDPPFAPEAKDGDFV